MNAYTGGLGALGLERASRWGARDRAAGWLAHERAQHRDPQHPHVLPERERCLASGGAQGVVGGAWPHVGRISAHGQIRGEARNGRSDVRRHENASKRRSAKAPSSSAAISRNWEVTSLCLAQTDHDCHFTYRPANNPIIDKYIVDTRRAFGLELQAAKGKTGGMGLLRSLMKKRSVALMNDQKYNKGLAAPLFGYDCMTADGPTRMALRFKVPLIPITGRRIEGTRFVATAYPPIELDYDNPGDEAVAAGVLRVNQFMEARIREAPEQWFWSHRRWPKEAWAMAGVS